VGQLRLSAIDTYSVKDLILVGDRCAPDAEESGPRECAGLAQNGARQPLLACPQCSKSMRPVRRKDGGHSWFCRKHDWFMAARNWQLIEPPRCPKCATPMLHRDKPLAKGEYFWACFPHNVFLPSDVFGQLCEAPPARRVRPTSERVAPV
jgi:hypothetical protein